MATAAKYRIERGIPAPADGRKSQYPFDEMEPGDSFFIPGMKSSAEISSSVSYRKNRYQEKYVCRAVEGGLRVWRIA
jgi:hypothetical protein